MSSNVLKIRATSGGATAPAREPSARPAGAADAGRGASRSYAFGGPAGQNPTGRTSIAAQLPGDIFNHP